ncbi:hypothetical protein HK096_009470, partial [Nowakowskiella sp. JEL0078]
METQPIHTFVPLEAPLNHDTLVNIDSRSRDELSSLLSMSLSSLDLFTRAEEQQQILFDHDQLLFWDADEHDVLESADSSDGSSLLPYLPDDLCALSSPCELAASTVDIPNYEYHAVSNPENKDSDVCFSAESNGHVVFNEPLSRLIVRIKELFDIKNDVILEFPELKLSFPEV